MTPKEGGHGKYSIVAIQPRREDVGNTHYFLDSHGGMKWEIISSCHTAKEGGNTLWLPDSQGWRTLEILITCHTFMEGGYGKYSLVTRQPRREDVGNT